MTKKTSARQLSAAMDRVSTETVKLRKWTAELLTAKGTPKQLELTRRRIMASCRKLAVYAEKLEVAVLYVGLPVPMNPHPKEAPKTKTKTAPKAPPKPARKRSVKS